MTSYDGKGIFTGRLHLCRRAVATANAAVATAVAFTAASTGMFAVITTSVTVTTCPTNPALSFWSMCRQYPSRRKKWTVRGITCPFYAAASRAKEQEAVNFLEKKVDGIKGYDLDMTVMAAIMCLGIVLGSGFIMVAGGGVRWVKLSFSLLLVVAQK